MKICFFDLETTNLAANFGYILCAGWKFWEEPGFHVVSVGDFPKLLKSDPTNDKEVVRSICGILAASDIIVTWYGARFDVPFLNSRLIAHGLDPLPPVPHIDLWRVARYKLRLHSNRLASVADFLELPSKTPLTPKIWIRAMAGHPASLDYIKDHCQRDVEVLELAYEKLRHLVVSHPNVTLAEPLAEPACPFCGSTELQKRGWNYARVSRKQRYFCASCRAWSSGAPERLGEVIVR